MVKAPRPMRAEANDVANCVLDGADCLSLDQETANGDYPINAVSFLSKITVETEKTLNYKKIYNDIKLYSPSPAGGAESVAAAVNLAVQE